ncbi:MAG: Gfo/Idh/MocA family protein, partial [Hyphococcus sp.]
MASPTGKVAIVGTGFVADLYMRSLKTFPGIDVAGAFDIDAARLQAFCAYWTVPTAESLDSLLANDAIDLVLNLTNPHAHYAVSKAALEAGRHVYSEKPLATSMDDARALRQLAHGKKLMLASAPCSWLSEAAQTVWKSISTGSIGTPRLVYAELDDGFIPQAPYRQWKSESGAPWPYEDEFKTGCTLEHAGYYLTWLMAVFGPVRRVVAAAANTVPGKLPGGAETAPDYSTAVLFFHTGVVARLTCSIVAPHDHSLRIIGDDGVLLLDECWNNVAPVRVGGRHVLRRRLIESPLPQRQKIKGETHPKVGRWGAAAMNFALGPAEMLAA